MEKYRTGVYPGTFDPVTNGHLDIISRAAKVLDRLIVGVAQNVGKGPLFTLEQRVELTREAVDALNLEGTIIEIRPFNGLLMNFALQQGASVIVRGLRAVSDFEYEFQMAGMNARLDSRVETIFLMASEGSQFISSRFVKEISFLEGKIDSFVPAVVRKALKQRFAEGERPW
ncbi:MULTISPECIES: pantetheine-phosphate adenylyltransferase [unclassified Haematospirillum]|uniref:pantetheine-phosphate adenylyltransferase n=1 Tax=unclassified Haematospirillum TaxID=2622088 RepID=UPI001439F768|nr:MULTISPECIES: pantetheine-phosphate adenylyltransferase [unclassified Haematospirillum]NKD54312.1 pantetheine-phosphate adenylyltransferase [Haematospirillum sp. H4890]NKD74356.1 pantetheine-phosphate adenylyltransferase [Haematospirillum sp. H4485]